ncbi:hypothetical protein SDC9_123540 [bioreactor metagenome]|uniref:Uncharacterized protein n=1 Tax=bioreactor metagenome TaxID=1076179 RepID=A0A645CI93_9ZZZZ
MLKKMCDSVGHSDEILVRSGFKGAVNGTVTRPEQSKGALVILRY